VVGGRSDPLHSGLGFMNRPQHLIGWNDGFNPLPFVLVEDVAAAILSALEMPGIAGKTYNLVGDIRPKARQYMEELRRRTGRAVDYHPQWLAWLSLSENAKWLIKLATGRRNVFRTSRRDLASRGLMTQFDTSAAKRDLDWHPVVDQERFYAAVFAGHEAPARPGRG